MSVGAVVIVLLGVALVAAILRAPRFDPLRPGWRAPKEKRLASRNAKGGHVMSGKVIAAVVVHASLLALAAESGVTQGRLATASPGQQAAATGELLAAIHHRAVEDDWDDWLEDSVEDIADDGLGRLYAKGKPACK